MRTILNALQGFDYNNLTLFQKEMMRRNIVRFVLDLMKLERNNRMQFLEILWKIPSSAYHERDKERLERFEPQMSSIFHMAKFSNKKYSIIAIAREVNKYYNFHTGVLPDFFLDIFKCAWDGDLKPFKTLLTSGDKSLEDLAFLFLMSLGAKNLNEEFCRSLMRLGPTHAQLTGRALILEYFCKDEPLTDDDLHLFCLAHVYNNECRPIIRYYDKVIKRVTPAQANSFLLESKPRRGFEPHSLQKGKNILKKHAESLLI